MESALASHFDSVICNDAHPYLIAMLNAVQHGYVLPDQCTEEQYAYIKAHKEEDPALTGFVGFACSFAGKWCSSYARGRASENFCASGKRLMMRKMETLMHARFLCRDYRDVPIPEGAVIYADPPYRGTSGYSGVGKFDGDCFWQYMREISQQHAVYISEQTAPDDFMPIWQREYTRGLRRDNKNIRAVEKLYVHRCNAQKLDIANKTDT